MKYLTLLFTLAILALPPVFTGCSNLNSTSYKAAASTQVTVEAAMTAWGDYVAKFHPGAAAEAKVKAAYEKYQAAALVVADTGAALSKYAGTTNAPMATTVFNAALSAASASLSDLITLLQSFGVKL